MKRLLLLGGGHSHVEVIRQMALVPPPDTQIVVASPDRDTPYSGMLPGLVAGHYGFGECHIDLDHLCASANARFHRAAAIAIDPQSRSVVLSDGSTQHYDVVSIDIGSTPPVNGIAGAMEHVIRVKPVAAFLRVWDGILKTVTRTRCAPQIVVVGGGAGGVELALALHHRLSQICAPPPRMHVVTDAETILSGHARKVVNIVERILVERGVVIHARSRAVGVERGRLYTSGGRAIDADHLFWATGASAPPWIARSGIQSDRGFISVNAFLQSVSHPDVFAAGDIASMAGHRVPKSGVYAVRQGPPLTINLRRALGSQRFVPYVPQRTTLALISTGNPYAVASYGPIAFEGAWVWRWKDRIDRRFMRRYQAASPANDGGKPAA